MNEFKQVDSTQLAGAGVAAMLLADWAANGTKMNSFNKDAASNRLL